MNFYFFMYKLGFINNKKLPFFEYIASGAKKAEGRVTNDYIKSFKVGEKLLLQARGEFVVCEISCLNFYDSFEEMLNSEGFENMVPFVDSFDEALKVYNGFPGSDRVKKRGCCAIGIKYIEGKLKNAR